MLHHQTPKASRSPDDALLNKYTLPSEQSPSQVISVTPYNTFNPTPNPPTANHPTSSSFMSVHQTPNSTDTPNTPHSHTLIAHTAGIQTTDDTGADEPSVGLGERSVRSLAHLFDATDQEIDDFMHQERRCCGCCNCACGRCISHCWFLIACSGFVLLSSLPRLLTLIDFIVTVLIYSLSFGLSNPDIKFWQFLKEDFQEYSFNRSGASLVILAFCRMVILFWTFAYRFHLKRWAFIVASLTAIISALFIAIKFALNENDSLISLLIWSLAITLLEYLVWLALRRRRIKKPMLDLDPNHHLTAGDLTDIRTDLREANMISPVHGIGVQHDDVEPSRPIRTSSDANQVQSYHRLENGSDSSESDDEHHPPHPFRVPPSTASMSNSSSFTSAGSLGSSFFAKSQVPVDQDLDPQSLADPDSLFIEIDSLIVHYKLSINGRAVLAGSKSTIDSHLTGTRDLSQRLESHPPVQSATQVIDDSPKPATSTLSPSQPTFFQDAASATSSVLSPSHPSATTFHSPLILLHGFGSSLFTFRALWPDLTQHASIVLAFDRPGFGLTSRPIKDSQGSYGSYVVTSASSPRGVFTEQENPYTQEYSVKLLFKLMNKLGLESHRSILVGHSTGGAIALRAAITAPPLFGGCFLISPHLFTAGFPAMLKSLLSTKLGKLITQQLVRSELGEVALKRAWFDSKNIPTDVLTNHQRSLRIRGQMSALIDMAASTPTDKDPWMKLSERFDELAGRPRRSTSSSTSVVPVSEVETDMDSSRGTPVCIIHGIQDKLLDVSESIKAYKQMKSAGVNITLIKIDHCGHVPHEEFPSLTLDHLFGFLRDVEGQQETTAIKQQEEEAEIAHM